MSKLMTASLWLLVASALAGCVILPVPIPPAGKTGEVTERLRVGYSTRADAHALLGAPNRLATPRHEVWELEREPFKLFLLVAVGHGGGADTFAFGETIRSRVAIRYDARGKVAGWRWEGPGPEPSEGEERPRDFARATSEVRPKPFEPVRVLTWTARSFALSPDGSRAALLDEQAGRKQIQIVELATGRRVAESQDWPETCGAAAISLGFDATRIHSLPRNPARGIGLCRWQVDSGIMSADPMLSLELAKDLDQARFARLIDRFVVLGRTDGGASIWDLASDSRTALPPSDDGDFAPRASVSANSAMLAIGMTGGPDVPPQIMLHNLATGARRTLTLPGPADERVAALALTPKGDILAAHRWTHIEVWRLGGADTAPVLETVLLHPSTRAGLAFSEDGERLVAASTYALVWDTHDWREVGRGAPGTFASALTPSDALEISPNGSHIATPSGLWRIAPENGGAPPRELTLPPRGPMQQVWGERSDQAPKPHPGCVILPAGPPRSRAP